MIIRHDTHLSRGKVLMPVPLREWMPSSRFIPKDQFRNDVVVTRFRLTARLHDGYVAWRGWFEDRDDADAFLFAITSGSLRYERPLWDLPAPAWRPGIGENLSYEFATVTFLTTTGTANTWTVPSDWNDANNIVECLGAGGAGASVRVASGAKAYAVGGAGAGYGKSSNLTLTPSGSVTYGIGSGGIATLASANGTVNAGTSGGDTYFNGASYAAAVTGGLGGPGGGGTTSASSQTGASGSAGKGNVTGYTGGSSGSITTSSNHTKATGGGGAAGPNGAGNSSADSTLSSSEATNGGSGDAGSGGSGGLTTSNAEAVGGNGTEWQVSPAYGCGGGGGARIGTGIRLAGVGGNYGAGGGGAAVQTNNATGGNGSQGLIVVTYTPKSLSLANINLAMMGM